MEHKTAQIKKLRDSIAPSSATWLQALAQIQSEDGRQVTQAKMQLAKMQMGLTMEKALGGTQVSKLKRLDEDYLLMCLGSLVMALCESLNVGKSMNELQVYDAACTLTGKYWHLKLEEFAYIFREGKTGKYGQLFNRIDVQVLCEWCDKYLQSEELAYHHEKRHSSFKTSENEPMSIEMAKNLAGVFRHIEAKPVKNPIEVQPSSFEQWLDVFRKEAEASSPERVHELREIGRMKGIREVWELCDTLLGQHEAGIIDLPKAS